MFGKNKNKPDYRVRFQNARFRRQLSRAREYKRPQRAVPATAWQQLLKKFGLGSWWSKTLTAGIFLLLVYLVYVPNFLYIKSVDIAGTDEAGQTVAESLTASFLDKKIPWPQKNLIFLSAGGLKAFLLAHDQKILSVDAVQKKFPAALKIMLTPRQDEFLLENASSTAYSMANDGLVTGLVLPDASGTLPSSLLPLKYDSAAGLAVGQTALPAGSVKFLENLKQRLPALGRSPLAYFELADLSLPDLQAVMQNGLILKFDLNADLEQTLSRLTLLLAQFSDSDLKKIYYVDMRFAERGYVCNKGQPCTSSEAVPQTASSTAPAGLTP